MINKKGIGMIELIVSLGLVSLVLVMIMQLLVDVRYEDTLTRDKAANLVNQALIMKNIQLDLTSSSKKLTAVSDCSNISTKEACYQFTFLNGVNTEIKTLKVKDQQAIYNDEKKVLAGNAKYSFSDRSILWMESQGNLAILKIVVPADDGFGNSYNIEVVYTFTKGTVTKNF